VIWTPGWGPQVVAAQGGGGDHQRVGWLSDVVVNHASGEDLGAAAQGSDDHAAVLAGRGERYGPVTPRQPDDAGPAIHSFRSASLTARAR
jgi:hypothetical protein